MQTAENASEHAIPCPWGNIMPKSLGSTWQMTRCAGDQRQFFGFLELSLYKRLMRRSHGICPLRVITNIQHAHTHSAWLSWSPHGNLDAQYLGSLSHCLACMIDTKAGRNVTIEARHWQLVEDLSIDQSMSNCFSSCLSLSTRARTFSECSYHCHILQFHIHSHSLPYFLPDLLEPEEPGREAGALFEPEEAGREGAGLGHEAGRGIPSGSAG